MAEPVAAGQAQDGGNWTLQVPLVRQLGTIVSPPAGTAPTTFTMNVTGYGSTTTLVTVNARVDSLETSA
jgi:hypothetical protein